MPHVRRLLPLLIGAVLPLVLGASSAHAGSHPARHHPAHAFSAVYRPTQHRPVPHRVQATRPHVQHFVQDRRRSLVRGS